MVLCTLKVHITVWLLSTVNFNYRVKTPSLDTVNDSGILQVLSADKCSYWIAEKIEDVHDHTLHTASLAGRGNPSQDVDLCGTTDPNTSSTANHQYR